MSSRNASKKNVNNRLIQTLHAHRKNPDAPIQLSTGYWAIVTPISIQILSDVEDAVEDPVIPTFLIKDKGRKEPNPNDPSYLKAVEKANEQRALAVSACVATLGVRLVKGEKGDKFTLPSSDWLRNLKWLIKAKHIATDTLDEFDLQDSYELELLFKLKVAVAAPDIEMISALSGVSEGAVQEQMERFPGNEK